MEHCFSRAAHEHLSWGQRTADKLAKIVGSWPFIICQTIVIICWISMNGYLLIRGQLLHHSWDPYPFILLNLLLSFQAAYTGPVVMMSQNRQAEKDRLMAEKDYHTNVKAEKEIKTIIKHLTHQHSLIQEILARLEVHETKVSGSFEPASEVV